MKRAVVYAAAIATLLTAGAMGPPEGLASPRLADSQAAAPGTQTQEIREKTCRYQWVDRGQWTAREERRTALCVLDHWSVEGGWTKFRQVGACESGWWRFASNGGSYLGLFQHEAGSWISRVRWAMPSGWRVGAWARWTNSRAQIVTTARMVHASGWGAWACA
jgi:hypothetical protein